MARKTEELIVLDFDVELTPAQLMAVNVPVNYYSEKGAEAITYHVDISFADFKDMKRRAIEKVKHTIGHAIRENTAEKFVINPDKDADGNALPRTVVESTGYPPKQAKQMTVADVGAMLATTKEESAKAILVAELEALLAQYKPAAEVKPVQPAVVNPPKNNRQNRPHTR